MKKVFLLLLLSVVTVFAYADDTKYKGDINDDGEISLADMVKLASNILNNVAYNSVHDLNNDKKVDDADLQQLADIILNNIKSPQGGLDVGIGDWEDGGEFGGVVGARGIQSSPFTPFSISETKFDGNKYYFDVNLSEQNNNLFCSAIINIKLPSNLNYCVDNGNNPIIECGAITANHRVYGKPTLQKDGSLRFIVFDNELTSFKQATGSIARVYVTSQATEGLVSILPSELATRGNNGIGSTVKKTAEMSFSLKDANVYKLTYLVDGVEYKTMDVKYGEQITPESAPTKEGYTFSGWSGLPETMPARDVTVTGTFSVNAYKLTYVVDGKEYKTFDVAYGERVTPEAEPTKEGYTFSGWSGLPETMPARDVTVAGTFSVNVYKLVYVVDGEVYKTYDVAYGEQIIPESEPMKEGYSFSGWIYIPETMPAKDVVVTGTFSVNVYKLTYVVDGEEYKTYEVAYGEEITPEPEPTREGHTFSGWSDIPETMPAQDVIVTGTFTIETAIGTIYSSNQKVNVYNLNGMKVYEYMDMKEALRQLPKGIYIINGRKIQKQ